eukprot:gnl/Dysnectes_brevis/315_a349_6470.p1 GENE.gnl/Dysnectes_brevis/315_a349_6470~~gnl/Dysnectes_brevis/315_a349_6470.p1  ORF type:complete len:253 (-),score=75.56 gnl/Dysnectes_brevis/315_a349_6470:74-832(-)
MIKVVIIFLCLPIAIAVLSNVLFQQEIEVENTELIVTLDGASATGKTPTAELLRTSLDLLHVENGRFFRAFTYVLLEQDLPHTNPPHELIQAFYDFGCDRQIIDNTVQVVCNDVVLDDSHLRSPPVNAAVASYSTVLPIRRHVQTIVRETREIAQAMGKRGVLCDGRVCGSVVFPDADLKFYFTATEASRKHRRHVIEGETDDIVTRDQIDRSRVHDPFVRPDGSYAVDTTGLSYDELRSHIVSILETRQLM